MKLFCNVFIPFDYGVTDIIAAEYEVRHGNIACRTVLNIHISQVDPCIGAQVIGIPITL